MQGIACAYYSVVLIEGWFVFDNYPQTPLTRFEIIWILWMAGKSKQILPGRN